MGRRVVLAAAMAVTTIPSLVAQDARSAASLSADKAQDPFVIHLDRAVDPSLVTVMYAVKDTRGWSSRYAVRAPEVDIQRRAIRLSTGERGQATALVAVVYCRGFRFAFVDVPSLTQRETTVALVPLRDVVLRGRVDLGGLPITGPWTLEIGYDASAAVLGLEIPVMMRGTTGGFGGSFPSSATTVATTTVASDGAFVARVPDFLDDPVVSAHPGRFTLFFLSGLSKHELVLAGQDRAGPGLDLAKTYDPIALHVVGGVSSKR